MDNQKKQVSSNVGHQDPQADPREPAIDDRGLQDNPDRFAGNEDDRRDVIKQGSSLSGSTKRNNDATEKAIHPDEAEQGANPEGQNQDQDPGMRQKQNQNDQKD